MNMFMSRAILLVTGTVLISILVLPFISIAQSTTSATTSTSTTDTPPVAITPSAPVTPAALSETAQNRIRNLTDIMSDRMDGAVKRLQNVHDRLDTRLMKVGETGADVSIARANLQIAQNQLDTARTTLSNIDSNVDGFLGSNNPQENWLEVKRLYNETTTSIVAAHTTLKLTLTDTEQAMTAPVIPVTSTSSEPAQ